MMEHCYLRLLYRRTDLSSFLTAFPLERCSLLFLTRLHRRLWANKCGLVSLRTFQNTKKKKMSAVIVTWCRRTRIIQVGGTTRAAWAPIGQGSSICCSMKQDILLWYWKERSSATCSSMVICQMKWCDVKLFQILTACLHQEQLMATISLLWKANFCWKPCTDKMYGTYLFWKL